MPPGASILMRGLGMRGTSRYIKNKKRGTENPGAYDRPTVLNHDGDGDSYSVPPGFRGDGQFGFPPYTPDEGTTMASKKSLRSSEGLSEDYVWRLFEHERSKWARQGFISPYKDYRSRAARDDLEFRLWRHWHPEREKIKKWMNEEDDKRYGRPHDPINNDPRSYGGLPGGYGYDDRGHDQEPYRQRRGAVNYKRPSHHRRGLVDHRDPRNCPPYPPARTTQGPRDTRSPPYPEYVPTRGQGHSRVYAEYDPRGEEIPAFFPRDLRHHRHGPDYEAYEDKENEDTESQQSLQSFIRDRDRRRRPLSPQIIYPRAPPYYGRRLGHRRRHGRHENNIDEELANELFRGRGAYMDHGRHAYGIEREGGRFGMGRRNYEDERLDYGFSAGEDDGIGF